MNNYQGKKTPSTLSTVVITGLSMNNYQGKKTPSTLSTVVITGLLASTSLPVINTQKSEVESIDFAESSNYATINKGVSSTTKLNNAEFFSRKISEKNLQLIALLDSWLEEDAVKIEEDSDFKDIMKSIDENRLSDRKLFS